MSRVKFELILIMHIHVFEFKKFFKAVSKFRKNHREGHYVKNSLEMRILHFLLYFLTDIEPLTVYWRGCEVSLRLILFSF